MQTPLLTTAFSSSSLTRSFSARIIRLFVALHLHMPIHRLAADHQFTRADKFICDYVRYWCNCFSSTSICRIFFCWKLDERIFSERISLVGRTHGVYSRISQKPVQQECMREFLFQFIPYFLVNIVNDMDVNHDIAYNQPAE